MKYTHSTSRADGSLCNDTDLPHVLLAAACVGEFTLVQDGMNQGMGVPSPLVGLSAVWSHFVSFLIGDPSSMGKPLVRLTRLLGLQALPPCQG